ncbi:NAD(P)-binding protein [Fragilariopsis cylindrus CCMP1102]|uniref:NAD(P)-binding protein n=1 Tax=Fragilariopsis cylindrus CCMP1102 TaxID=635003 RepID=A0A1E7F4L0_9STRA|nr:NAD(P)-binding protein [Fragilariopsis cylindrus CCMP1102]|eukprot:OEU13121.1 NAD(P)-binding protein [Fragilariopsis cylindrus CCMP1102]
MANNNRILLRLKDVHAITGSSQGIGLEAATRLIADGHTVYHACRNQERANVALQESGGGIPMICDLNDFHSIRNFAEQLINKSTPNGGGLDVLCLNAGIAPSTKSTVPKLTKDGYEECIGVNHLGHFLLANLLKDHLLKKSSSSSSGNSGRIVITASSVHDPEGPGGAVGGKGGATLGDLSGLGINLTDKNKNNSADAPTMPDGSITYDGGKIYKDSKLCNLLFMREAVKRWGGNNGNGNDNDEDGLTILSFNPGFIPSSGLFRAPREDNWFGATAFTFIAGVIGFAVPIEIGGGRLAYMATVGNTKKSTTTDGIKNGSYFSADVKSKGTTIEDGFDGQTTISVEASNDDIASQLWDISAKIVGV